MKRKVFIIAIFCLCGLFYAFSDAAVLKQPGILLQEAVYAEEISGDLDKAMSLYQMVLDAAEPGKPFAAQAAFRLGLCHLKKGNTVKAAEFFNTVVSKYSGEETIVAKARQELEKLNQTKTSSGKRLTLSHDDGKFTSKLSSAGSGHVVRFSVPEEGYVLTSIRFFGSRYGEYAPPEENFTAWLCDKDFQPLKEFSFPYALFRARGQTRWADLKVEPTELPQEFYICLGFDPHQTKGIYMYYDESSSGNSFMGLPGGELRPYDKGDWMIRAILEKTGNADAQGSAPPATMHGNTLQSQIDAAHPDSTIIVPDGVHAQPLTVNKPLTIKGQSRQGSIVEVTSNSPALAIDLKGKGAVILENLTIKWQLATSDKENPAPFAIAIKDGHLTMRNCCVLPLGNPQRCPSAVYAKGFSKLDIDTCRFEGYEYTISFGEGTSGSVKNSLVMDSGHQGIMLYTGANVDVTGSIVTGSKFHGVRSTGGQLTMKDNLIIENANRGVYLGNRSAQGTIINNIFVRNATAIDGFAQSVCEIGHNVILESVYAGVGMRSTCRFHIHDNILQGNDKGCIMFIEGGDGGSSCQRNTFWKNKMDTENMDKVSDSILADPCFAASSEGDFSLKPGPALEQKQGLTDAEGFRELWRRWRNRNDINEPKTTVIEDAKG